jgi:hypothetical protein
MLRRARKLARGRRALAAIAVGLSGACAERTGPVVKDAHDARVVDQGVELSCRIGAESVRCTAHNRGATGKLICFEPHLGVRRTGRSHGFRECTSWLTPGMTAQLTLDRFGVRPAEACAPDLKGCVLRLFRDGEPLSARLAFIRALEAEAPEAGRHHPTTAECETLRRAWRGRGFLGRFERVLEDPDLSAGLCLRLSRETFDCLAAAKTRDDVAQCGRTIPVGTTSVQRRR